MRTIFFIFLIYQLTPCAFAKQKQKIQCDITNYKNFIKKPGFHRCNLEWADLRGEDLRGANLRGANLQNTKLESADLSNAILQGANLINAKLRVKYIRLVGNTKLEGANLQGAFIIGADFRGVNLRGADLRGANLSYTNLRGANLQNTKLQSAVLELADLEVADFAGAVLTGAKLLQVDLREVKLDGAKLHGASLFSVSVTAKQAEYLKRQGLRSGFSFSQQRNLATASYPGKKKPSTNKLNIGKREKTCKDLNELTSDIITLGKKYKGDIPEKVSQNIVEKYPLGMDALETSDCVNTKKGEEGLCPIKKAFKRLKCKGKWVEIINILDSI